MAAVLNSVPTFGIEPVAKDLVQCQDLVPRAGLAPHRSRLRGHEQRLSVSLNSCCHGREILSHDNL